jgi:MerR family transcriptional regulator, copper efflux regulator
MRITEAAEKLGMTPRMLRYRESLGLLPALRPASRRSRGRTASPDSAARRSAGPGPVAGGYGPAGSGAYGAGPVRSGPLNSGGPDPGGRAAAGSRWDAPGRPMAGGGQASGGPAGTHRQFSDADMAAVALGLSIERRYDISPVALAFGLRVLADPRVRADVAELGRRIGRLQAAPARALDFEQERALRLLNRP